MMDFRGASWVGDIYQKFEAMCLEVEETICEDAVKFVGSQVQNVGSNMKKFYTDVMQDLASPDSTAPDTKSDENNKSGNKEDTKQVGNQFTNDLKVIDRGDGDQVSSLDEDKTAGCKKVHKTNTDVMQDLASPDSTAPDTKIEENNKSGNKEDTKQVGKQFTNDLKVIDRVDGDQVSSLDEDKTVSCKKVPKKDCCQKTTSTNQVSEYRASDNQDGVSLVPEIIHEYATPEHMASIERNFSIKSNALGDSKTCQSTGELVALSDTGKEYAGKKVVSKTNDTMDLKGETTNEDKMKLEESCVFVNENNISFSSYKDGKPLSYKKKMREAFSLKKISSRRQEYKKLVTQYGSVNTSSESVNTSSSLACVDTVPHTVSPQSNTAELSDWELL